MSVPLDRLYNFLGDCCDQDVIIYRFFPFGSKNLLECLPLQDRAWYDAMILPHVWFFDQECIDFSNWTAVSRYFMHDRQMIKTDFPVHWLRNRSLVPYHLCANAIVVHSELNSQEVDTLAAHGYQTVHWFSHAAIARDWYRYAEHDPALLQKGQSAQHRFLIYNRAWTGTREYRLWFANALAQTGLISECNTSLAFIDGQRHYQQHVFKNPVWRPILRLEDYFDQNHTPSDASADYCSSDYGHQIIEVVLETIFDDSKISLTEKSLRPIATATPFIVAGPPGSLQYLRHYGFQTFSPWINEAYDKEPDSHARLTMIVQELQRLANLSHADFGRVLDHCQQIAYKNREIFFSNSFHAKIIDEYRSGINHVVELVSSQVDPRPWNMVKSTHTVQQQQQIDQYLQLQKSFMR